MYNTKNTAVKYNKKIYSKKTKARIQRHKRVRYHNDAVLFPDDTTAATRKRRKSLKKRYANPAIFERIRVLSNHKQLE
jgi:hypothetical protein